MKTTSNELKNLQTKKSFLDKEVSRLSKDILKIKSEISDLDKKIYKLSQLDCAVIVSEHAILRILERRFGQEEMIQEVIKQIQEEIAPKLISKTCKINLSDGLQAVISKNVLITVK
jgi:chaperonin cofactor prefoldin